MLSKIISRQLKLTGLVGKKTPMYMFGHASHDHHDYSVHIDREATWIKYKTNRKLACIEGIEDTHYKLKPADDSDPYVHLKENPTFSLQNLAYNDPYYHEDDHEQLVNEPHGYASGMDPIDTRYDTVVPHVLTMGSLMLIALVIAFLEETPTNEGLLYREKLAIDYVEGTLEAKNKELNDIKDRIKQLSSE